MALTERNCDLDYYKEVQLLNHRILGQLIFLMKRQNY
jgi:hypothetical protein